MCLFYDKVPKILETFLVGPQVFPSDKVPTNTFKGIKIPGLRD